MDAEWIKNMLLNFLTDKSLSKVKQEIDDFPNIDFYYDLSWVRFNFLCQGDWICEEFEIFEEYKNKNKIFTFIGFVLKFFFKEQILFWKKRKIDAFILSNTCDNEITNTSMNKPNILYSPLVNFNKYKELLVNSKLFNNQRINSHLDDIKNQYLTHILYLPAWVHCKESIIFLDKIFYCESSLYDRDILLKKRLFSLWQVAFYFLLTKLSIHFSRPWEQINRVGI